MVIREDVAIRGDHDARAQTLLCLIRRAITRISAAAAFAIISFRRGARRATLTLARIVRPQGTVFIVLSAGCAGNIEKPPKERIVEELRHVLATDGFARMDIHYTRCRALDDG